ncbi:UNVERIFIED_CONTAM: hypothetical protein Sradi_2754900 [Sesamum radiatum]|uniref:Uncharacterized protein n=1 Tax=Sesamum radiatum TaxID=300843 RepID=A0AAW2S8C5_SESRA
MIVQTFIDGKTTRDVYICSGSVWPGLRKVRLKSPFESDRKMPVYGACILVFCSWTGLKIHALFRTMLLQEKWLKYRTLNSPEVLHQAGKGLFKTISETPETEHFMLHRM